MRVKLTIAAIVVTVMTAGLFGVAVRGCGSNEHPGRDDVHDELRTADNGPVHGQHVSARQCRGRSDLNGSIRCRPGRVLRHSRSVQRNDRDGVRILGVECDTGRIHARHPHDALRQRATSCPRSRSTSSSSPAVRRAL